MNDSKLDSRRPRARTLVLSDGRILAYATYGDSRGRPLLYLHGGGSSRLEPAYAQAHARRNRIHIVAIDRPGYGASTPLATMDFASASRDLLELADVLKLERFAVAGMSAGAPYALHLAASAPQRVGLVALINPSPDTSDTAWKHASLLVRVAIHVSSAPWLLRWSVRRLKADPARAARKAAKRWGWGDEGLAQFAAMIDEGLRQPGGIATLADEARRVLRTPWGLDWSRIGCPVLAICGLKDSSRPFYRALAQRHAGLTVMDIPGPHMPIVTGAAWDRIGETLAVAS